MSDIVKNPSHYCAGRKYKDKTIEDLEKAKTYIDFEIEALKQDELDKFVGLANAMESELSDKV